MLALAALSLGLANTARADVLPVQNLTFDDYSGPSPKDYFSTVNPAGWYRGPVAGSDDLVFIDAPGTATVTGGGSNSYAVYGPFANPPPGGNFVQADGNPDFESEFKQDIAGLTIGVTYTLSFWQAAGQQTGFVGDTTEQWKVFFGNDAVTVNCPSSPCTIDYGTNQLYTSPLMSTPSGSTSPWEEVTASFIATATTETLTFLAWGDGGNTTNLPPTVFLAGVNSPAVPEPGTLSLLGVGLAGLGIAARRKRARFGRGK